MNVKKNKFARGLAICLSLALATGGLTSFNASVKSTKAAESAVVTESAVSDAAVSGSSVSEGGVSASDSAITPEETTEPTPVPGDDTTEPTPIPTEDGDDTTEPTPIPTEDADDTTEPTPTPDSAASGGAIDVDLSQYVLVAPQTVTARGGSKRVRLTWSGVTNADGYYIYSRPSDSATYTKIGTVTDGTTLTYVKKSLTQGATYYFRVAAYRTVNGTEVEGTLSTIVSAATAKVAKTSKAAKTYKGKSAFTKSPAYTKYTKMKNKMSYAKSFAIPGMKNTNVAGFACTTMIPKAICYAGNYLLISAYDSTGVDYSVIYVVSKAAKSYVTTLVMPNKAKLAGMAYDGTNIWVTNGSSVSCFPYTFVTQAVAGGAAYKSLAAYTKDCPVNTTASYIGYYDGTLWVGPNTSTSTTMYGYTVNNKTADPSLTKRYSMAMPSRTQGITFKTDGTLVITRSYRTKLTQSGYVSQIRTYMPSYSTPTAAGKIKKNKMIAKSKMPPRIEGVAVYGSYTYAVFSSSAYKACAYPVDRVIALSSSKLLV